MKEKEAGNKKLPVYLEEIYGWLYKNDKICDLFEKNWFLNLITLGNHNKLVETTLKEIASSSKVLQLGATFGPLTDAVAMRVGKYGRYDILDVDEHQLKRAEAKYAGKYPYMNFYCKDATKVVNAEDYDVVICFMLLHEVPILSKTKLVDNALASVKIGGRVIFVDYHNPRPFYPLRYFVRMFNRLYQPFAEKLWDREIHSYAEKKTDFIWLKSTYFGCMYQKVVAHKKDKAAEPSVDKLLF